MLFFNYYKIMPEAKTFVAICYLAIILQHTELTYGWAWRCEDHKCIRSEDPSGYSDDGPPGTSLAVCRLTCGQFGAVWPQPTGRIAISDKLINFDTSNVEFNFSAVVDLDQSPVNEFVSAVGSLFLDNLSRLCGINCSTVPETSVKVYLATSSGDLTLNWHTDESYSVEVTTRDNIVTVQIQAATAYGARHGLETLTQLTTYTTTADGHNNQLVMVTNAKISDKPKFPHRGLLLDTARHYLPLRSLLRTIDAMATCKLNILHWHATDSHSFPLVLPSVPQLARYGAYSAAEVYTMADVKEVLDYARLRGVRVLLELDMPAHAGNGWQWGVSSGFGSLAVCVNRQPWKQFCLQPPCGQLNPANQNMYHVLSHVFEDLVNVLPHGEIFHMGGDEVHFQCWNQSYELTQWMLSRGMRLTQSDFINVWGEFHRRALQLWDMKVGDEKTPIVLWSSLLTTDGVIEEQLNKSRFVIETWTDERDPLATRLLNKGYRVIVATLDAWYLDHGFWGSTSYRNWRRAYDSHLPRHRNVLGGELAMWGELVDDSNLDGRVWPRTTAAAERLWSDPDTDSSLAENRLLEQRERLLRRGVTPEAIAPQWCAHNQGKCLFSANTS